MPPSSQLPTSRTLIGIEWPDATPMARLIEDGRSPSVLRPLVDLHFNYRAGKDSRRRCVGHTPFRDRNRYVDCDNAPEPGGRKCTRCNIVDATFASNLHHAHTRGRSELDPSVVAHLGQENKLYLAGFRDGSIKVGTSTTSRNHRRLLEQGAWAARVVATSTDGYAVREVEDLVTAELDVPQAVSTSRKLDGLVRPIGDDQIHDALDAQAALIDTLINRLSDERVTSCLDTWSRTEFDVRLGDKRLGRVHRYPLRLASGSHDFRIVAACGRIALVERPASPDWFAVDLQALFGIEVTLGDFTSDEVAIQDSLF